MKEIIGTYIDRKTRKRYSVEKHTNEIVHNPLNGPRTVQKCSFEYKTSCGIDLQPLNDDLSSFELIQIDGIIDHVKP